MKKFDDIKPSKEQENCISYTAGDLLVNGVPGAGKSIVLLKRALKFYNASNPDEKRVVLLTTFTNALNKYTNDVFSKADIDTNRMLIITMDKYCSNIYRRLFGSFNAISKESDWKRFIAEAMQNHFKKHGQQHRFYGIDEKFWRDEFLWIKQKNIKNLQEYQSAERTGRGGSVRIKRDERKIVYELFEEYCSVLSKYHRIDWEDIYIRILNSNRDLTQFKYKYVMVDEAQDLSFVKLKVAKMLATDSITVAADKAQKIYNTGFTWRELGIDIRGNASKTLHKTFRSTKQIVQLAESLFEINRAMEGDKGEYTDPVLPALLGADYPFIVRCSSQADEKLFITKLIMDLLKDEVTIGILYRNYDEKQNIISLLNSRRIRYEEINQSNNWSLQRSGVKVATLHSSKGLEFDIVIIPFFNSTFFPLASELENADSEQVDEVKAKERNLLYVGMTRAKSMLYMVYSGAESPFLAEFSPEYYNYFSSDGKELEKPIRSFVPQSNSNEVIGKNDTIRAHFEGNPSPRILCGKGIDGWKFEGKHVGDRVPGIKEVYVIDEILERGDPEESTVALEWSAKEKYITPSCLKFADTLAKYGVPAPTTVGSELMGSDGSVIAEAELAWEKHKTVFLRNDQRSFKEIWEGMNWTVITESTPLSQIEFNGDD